MRTLAQYAPGHRQDGTPSGRLLDLDQQLLGGEGVGERRVLSLWEAEPRTAVCPLLGAHAAHVVGVHARQYRAFGGA